MFFAQNALMDLLQIFFETQHKHAKDDDTLEWTKSFGQQENKGKANNNHTGIDNSGSDANWGNKPINDSTKDIRHDKKAHQNQPNTDKAVSFIAKEKEDTSLGSKGNDSGRGKSEDGASGSSDKVFKEKGNTSGMGRNVINPDIKKGKQSIAKEDKEDQKLLGKLKSQKISTDLNSRWSAAEEQKQSESLLWGSESGGNRKEITKGIPNEDASLNEAWA